MLAESNHKKRILLVDDDRQAARNLSMLLETRGYSVTAVSTQDNVTDKASPVIDLILISIILTDRKGLEVCRILKEEQSTSSIPIIILSENKCSEDAVESLYMGADDYVVKPYDHDELVARMEAVLRRSSLFSSSRLISQGEEAIVQELRKIILEKLVTPYFQPIFQFKPFKISGLEMLSRPQIDSMLSNPEVLFKAAIHFGFYQELEIMSWKKAIHYIKDLLNGQDLFLNCNPYFIEGSKCSKVQSLFDESGLNIDNIVLEITERSAVANYKVFFDHLEKFRGVGFKFAVDDVGGGYASLESIVETKPEVVKIDRHIVDGICRDEFKRSIVKFIVSFCKENAIFCIAEGIETKEDLDVIIRLGVDAGQGYYLYRPTGDVDIEHMQAVSSKVT